MTNSAPVVSLILAAVLFAGGCIPNEHGRLGANRTGDVIEPPCSRLSAGELFVAECGARTTRPDALSRMPYVQSVAAGSAVVVWTSNAELAEHVELRSADGALIGRVTAQSPATRYLREGRQYEAVLDGLSPSSVYCYSITDEAGVVHGPVGFRTAPPPGAQAPIDVLVFGDSGNGSSDQWALRQQMDTVSADLIVHTGDVAYPTGTLPQYEAFVFSVYEDIFESIPFFPSAGNHDYATDDGGPYREVFVLPENGGADGRERYYSFDWGPIHFVALDTNVNGRAQADWLEQDLARTELPWRIVYAHHSPYSSGAHGSSTSFRSLYGPALARHGVKLVLTGHDHHYERTKPLDGITYVVTGGGGTSTRRPSPREFTAFAEDVLHFVHLRVEGAELRGYAIDARGREFDAFRIER